MDNHDHPVNALHNLAGRLKLGKPKWGYSSAHVDEDVCWTAVCHIGDSMYGQATEWTKDDAKGVAARIAISKLRTDYNVPRKNTY